MRQSEIKKNHEEVLRAQAGAGSGGYIIVDLPESRRSLFQDLLKGFEEFSRLKGYSVSFSVDSSFRDRIAFKFTLTDPDAVVGSERVRKDLQEYLHRISTGDPLDDIPQIVSIQEHEVLVTSLKNRVSFLQHNYNLAKNSIEFYENLMRRVGSVPLLTAPSVVVQTGGSLNSPTYHATNSTLALGDNNTIESRVHIATVYAERKDQIDLLSELLSTLRAKPSIKERDDVIRNLTNVKEELETSEAPERGRIAKWLENSKQAIQLGSLGFETVEAFQHILNAFGLSQ